MRICVCLSIGRHPVSGRERMAAGDRVALELALTSGAEVIGLHVGAGSERVLHDYLGMGLKRLDVVDTGNRDAVKSAAQVLRSDPPALVLSGARAETGHGTGLFPYLLAEGLGWPVLSQVGGFTLEGQDLRLLQVAKGGRRRLRTGSGPAVLIAAPGAAHPRLSTLAASRSGDIRHCGYDGPDAQAVDEPSMEIRPARRRGARLRPGRGPVASGASIRTDLTAETAAHAILEYLRAEGHLAHARSFPMNEGDSDV